MPARCLIEVANEAADGVIFAVDMLLLADEVTISKWYGVEFNFISIRAFLSFSHNRGIFN